MKADNPYVLKGSKNTTYTLTIVKEADTPEGNQLLTSTGSTGKDVYVIDTESDKATFKKWTDGKVGEGHPYLAKITNGPNNLIISINGSGDANCDGVVDTKDIEDIVNFIMGEPTSSETFDEKAADACEDEKVDAADVVKVVNIVMDNQ